MASLLQRFLSWAGYHGDVITRRRSYIYAPLRSPHIDIAQATRIQLQEKSREFERKNALYNRLCDLFELYTVGGGLQVYPTSSDSDWNASAKSAWTKWERFPDLTSRQPFGVLQSLVARKWFVDGEIFAIKARGESGRPRLQLVECERCGTPPDLAQLEGTSIFDGIQVDANGRPARYWFCSSGENRITWQAYNADSVLHIMEPGRPSQYRGIPFCYPCINDLIDLDDLQEMQMMAAKDAAEISNVIYNETGEVNVSAMLRRRFTQTDTNHAGDTTSESRTEYVRKALGGRTIALKTGEKLEQHRSDRPSIVDMAFWERLEEKICAGIGIPRILVYPETMQGTVYRGALDCADAFFRARSAVMQWFLREVYIWVTGYHIQTERDLFDKPEDWAEVSIQPPRSVNVDVGYNATAEQTALESGLTNYELIYSPRGLDWRSELRKKAEQAKYIRDLAEEFDIDPSEISVKQIDRPERIQTEQKKEALPEPDIPQPVPVE